MRSLSRRAWLGVAAVAVAATLVPQTAVAVPTTAADAVATSPRDYEKSGGHGSKKVAAGSDHTLFYPADIASSTGKHPVFIWGNGTGASVEQYEQLFTHLADWGYIVAAANTAQSGSGREMLAGIDVVAKQDATQGSALYGKVDLDKVAASGHSQGGGGAIAAGADKRVKTTIPVMPGPQGNVNKLHGPAFFISGQADIVVPAFYVKSRFLACDQVPAVYGQVKGADHLLTGDVRFRIIGAITAWLRYQLSGDEAAKSVFFGSAPGLQADKAGWSDFERNKLANGV